MVKKNHGHKPQAAGKSGPQQRGRKPLGKIRTTIKISPEMHAAGMIVAERHGSNFSQIVEEAIRREFLSPHPEHPRTAAEIESERKR